VHVLVIPKRVIPTINDIAPAAVETGGWDVSGGGASDEIAGADGLPHRVQLRPGAQQTVFHLHLHVLAGET